MHVVLSQFVTQTAAEMAVARLLMAGFARNDISVSRATEPRWHEIGDDESVLSAKMGMVMSVVGGLVSAALGVYFAPALIRWFFDGHHVHASSIAIGTAAAIASVLGSRLAVLLASAWSAGRRRGHEREEQDADDTIVGVRTSESLSRRACRILERSGARSVSTE